MNQDSSVCCVSFLLTMWLREAEISSPSRGSVNTTRERRRRPLQPEAVRCVERIDDPSVIDQGGDRRIGKQETADRRRAVARSRDASPGNGNRTEEEPRPSISVRIHLQLHGPITSSIIIYLIRFQLFYLLNDLCSPASWLICSYFIFIASYELKIHLNTCVVLTGCVYSDISAFYYLIMWGITYFDTFLTSMMSQYDTI